MDSLNSIEVKRNNLKALAEEARTSFSNAAKHLAKSFVHSLRADNIEAMTNCLPENVKKVTFTQTKAVINTISVDMTDGETLTKEVVIYDK